MPDKEIAVLKNGETLEMICLTAPLSEDVVSGLDALVKVTPPWKTGWDDRVSGKLTQWCRDCYIIGLLDGVMVGRMWYTVSGDFATYGSVFTAEKHQGKGIAGKLIDFCLKHLDAEPGLLATYLGVSKPIPRAMYAKAGWKPYNDTPWTCIMRRFKNSSDIPEFDREYFRGRPPYRVRPVRRADLPGLEALYNLMLPGAWFSRNQQHFIFSDIAVECQIDAMINDVETGTAECLVLQDERNAILGTSLLTRGPMFSQHIACLDFFAAPAAEEGTAMLVAQSLQGLLAKNAERIMMMQSSGDDAKNRIGEALGFRQTGKIVRYYQNKDVFTDRLVWEK